MSEKFLYVFPGAQRTATKLLQATLDINRDSLKEEGVSVARRQNFYKSGLHLKLQATNGIEEIAPGKRDELIEQVLGGAPTDKVVINIENMFGEISPRPYRNADKVLNNLKTLFPDYQIRVWFYIRRQDTYVESAFIREYQNGGEFDPAAYAQKFIEQPLDWMRLLTAMSKTVGPKNVRVVAYESINNGVGRYLSSFYKTFSQQSPNEMVARYKRERPFTNVSLSAKGMEILKAVFEVVRDKQERRKIANLLQTAYGSDKFPRYHLPSEQMELLKNAHEPLNARLMKRVRFAPDLANYYLFKDAVDENDAQVEHEAPAGARTA